MDTNAERWSNHHLCLYLNCFPGTGQVKAIKNKTRSLPHKGAVGDMYAQGDNIKEEGSV